MESVGSIGGCNSATWGVQDSGTIASTSVDSACRSGPPISMCISSVSRNADSQFLGNADNVASPYRLAEGILVGEPGA